MKHKAKSQGAGLELMNGRVTMAMTNLIDDGDTGCLEGVLKDYKAHKEEIKAYIISVLDYMKTERFSGINITQEQVTEAKKKINEVAKHVWKG